ncbi:hypothetical protein U1Q18_019680 [Sarracenia purpurea var. burkii]
MESAQPKCMFGPTPVRVISLDGTVVLVVGETERTESVVHIIQAIHIAFARRETCIERRSSLAGEASAMAATCYLLRQLGSRPISDPSDDLVILSMFSLSESECAFVASDPDLVGRNLGDGRRV